MVWSWVSSGLGCQMLLLERFGPLLGSGFVRVEFRLER